MSSKPTDSHKGGSQPSGGASASNSYEKLEYYQYIYVVLAVWTVNLIISPIWLRAFEFGPVEWVWRSLTYWKLQPMRVRA